MNSVIETQDTTPNYDLLDLELFIGTVEKTLTEARYDEIITLLAEANLPDEIFAQSIFQGKPAWQDKHWKRYGFTNAVQERRMTVLNVILPYPEELPKSENSYIQDQTKKPMTVAKTRPHQR
jgi:hypothetical protein